MTRWGKFGVSLCASVALLASASGASAELLTFDVIPAFAPKGPESPNWNNYVVNALTGIQNNIDLLDRETSAAAYERVSGPFPPEEIIYTPFNSWRGKASPNPDFQAPFLGEFGNRIHFGLHVVGTSEWDFALEDLTWELDSNDATDFFDLSGDFSGVNYSATRIGIDYGDDGVKGGADDMIINSGPGSQRVNELIYVGVGTGFLSMEPDAENGQDDINRTLADILAGCAGDKGSCFVDLSGTYTLPDKTGGRIATSSTVQIELVPEPSTAMLSVVGLLCSLGAIRRRR